MEKGSVYIDSSYGLHYPEGNFIIITEIKVAEFWFYTCKIAKNFE